MTPAVDRSCLGLVLAASGAGLLMQGAGDALARSGHGSTALALFLCGIALQFAAGAWRLTSRHAGRRERIVVALVLGLGLLASYVMLEPLLLDSFDELAHLGTLVRILDSHAIFPTNTVLPVSPYYPGLELATAATKWLTGLPLVVDQVIVLAAVRLVLILGIFLVVERACHSSRAGGVGVLVYAASPQFYGFDAQYAYETIALAFAVAVVYLLFVSIDAQRPRFGASFALALGSIGAVVISHHVTGWLTVTFLVVWFTGLYLTSHPFPALARRGWRPSLRFWSPAPASLPAEPSSESDLPAEPSSEPAEPSSESALPAEPSSDPAGQPSVEHELASALEQRRSRRRRQARVVGIAAVVGVVVGAVWTVFVGRLLTKYLGPLFSAAAADISAALGNGHGDRTLFKSSAGGGSPHWEIALILLAAASWCVVLLPALYSVIFKRSVRGGALRWLPAVIAATYPISVLANVSSGSKLVAERATTFIFFGMAVVVGAWLAVRISKDRRMLERLATIGLATIVFLGSLLFGIGPLVSLLPGPYRVGADSLSYGSPSLALAHWADTHLPAGSHVAADKENGVLLNAIGGVDTVTAQGGLVNPELLYFDRRLTPYDISLIRKADIRYIVVDDRLAQGRPLYGTYIASGEPSKRLTLAELNKFDSYPSAKRIYDNGPIKVYDVTDLLPASARAAPAGPPAGGSGLNVGIFVLAALVAVVWLLRLRRRPRPTQGIAHLVMCGVTGALVVGVFGAFLIRLARVPPEAVAVVVLLVLLVLGLLPRASRLRIWAFFRRSSPEGVETSASASAEGDLASLDHSRDAVASPPVVDRPDPAPSPSTSDRVRRPRTQLFLGCLGVVLFALGATIATVAALRDWTPPPELSVSTAASGRSVAQVQLGSAGPVAASLEVRRDGHTVWGSRLARTTGVQNVSLPPHVGKGSRVVLVSSGRALRRVDG